MEFFLLAFPALFSIINPLGGAFVFLSATRWLSPTTREQVARWIAIYSALILIASLYVGALVLGFFGISIPVLRVAGGIIIAVYGFRMLHEGETVEERKEALDELSEPDARRLAFYPLTLPVTVGPGTISVAVALGTNRPYLDVWFVLASVMSVVMICGLVYVMYRFSDRISHVIGETGTMVVARLMAFILFCIGIQIGWNGLEELLTNAIE
jgi:multiple antibiotic resistance protein